MKMGDLNDRQLISLQMQFSNTKLHWKNRREIGCQVLVALFPNMEARSQNHPLPSLRVWPMQWILKGFKNKELIVSNSTGYDLLKFFNNKTPHLFLIIIFSGQLTSHSTVNWNCLATFHFRVEFRFLKKSFLQPRNNLQQSLEFEA